MFCMPVIALLGCLISAVSASILTTKVTIKQARFLETYCVFPPKCGDIGARGVSCPFFFFFFLPLAISPSASTGFPERY